jgi:hypothetical protein
MSTARSPTPSTSQEELFRPGSPGAKWLESVSPRQENETDKADPDASTVTPRPNAARKLFPPSIAPTALIEPAQKSLSPIQRRAQRGTGERQLTAAAAAVAAAVTEATKLLEEAFDKASEDRVNDETAAHAQPAAPIPAPLPTTEPNDIQATNQPNDNNTNNTTNPLQQEQLTTNPTTPRQEIDKTSLSNNTPPSTRIKPSQLSIKRAAAPLAAPNLSFLNQSESTRCDMRTVLERASASFPLQTKHQSAFKSINSINDLVSYTNSKHIDMASAISSSSSGNLLRREIGQYFFSFMGRKHADCDTAAAATVIHSCQCRSDLNLLMRQAIVAGADMHTDALEEAADNAAATGEITSHSSTSQSLADMPPH